MRRVEYIGWDVNGKGWVAGDLVHNKKIIPEEPHLADRIMVGGYEVYPDSVGQFTGTWLDDDGEHKDIFEGDFIYTERDNRFSMIGQVVFSRGSFLLETHVIRPVKLYSLTEDSGEVVIYNSPSTEPLKLHLIRFSYEPEMQTMPGCLSGHQRTPLHNLKALCRV